jgi:hypothetical protein
VRFSYDKKARVISAEIDPQHSVRLDKNFFNNSITEEADRGATHKLSTYWLFATQYMAQLLAWLA